MGDDRAPIRSYARIFRPERRIYTVDGHRLPVPGGVPLGWLGYALAALLAVLVLSGRSWTVAVVLAAGAAVGGLLVGGRSAAMAAAAATAGGAQIAGFVLTSLDWPVRLLIVPALTATLATQATPDGRLAYRYALSWLVLQLRVSRRSLGRPLPEAGRRHRHGTRLPVAGDAHEWHFDRARVPGPALVTFAAPLLVSDGRSWRSRRRRVTHPPRRLGRAVTRRVERVELSDGERLELRS